MGAFKSSPQRLRQGRSGCAFPCSHFLSLSLPHLSLLCALSPSTSFSYSASHSYFHHPPLRTSHPHSLLPPFIPSLFLSSIPPCLFSPSFSLSLSLSFCLSLSLISLLLSVFAEAAVLSRGLVPVLCRPLQALQWLLCQPH